FGAAPEEYISERAKLNKLSYRYCERPLKDGRKYLLKPKKLYGMIKTDTRYIFKRVYLLCASAYAAKDMALAGAYINKAYKWGYFPQVKKYEDIGKLLLDKKPASILWAGRLLGWKHPEMAVTLAGRLKEKGYKFEINVIGNGELEAALRRMIEEKDLTDCVHMLGSMPPDRVREHMERSEIFLFTSDRSEGWGAVLNESMNSACAVIANKKIGSVPFLLRQGYNGLIYKDENEFYYLAEKCLRDRELRLTLGENAYNTIVNLWNPETAAQRIIDLSEKLLAENKFYYEEGPCSKAERI
ncbi:MAG: glycosyltransferase family 4 protein, partial [Clostridia bacterium]|nr:glycosyltransferase family 4 protein [Clostridia bacterium]